MKVEPENLRHYLCECCGDDSHTASGFVHNEDGNATAAYFVHWTLGKVDTHGAMFDLIVGEWGEGASPAGRSAVSLAFRSGPQGGFMIVDAGDRSIAESDLVGHALERADVLNTALAKHVFEIVDAIWLQDSRIAEIVESAA
jgi:hypothetical protein